MDSEERSLLSVVTKYKKGLIKIAVMAVAVIAIFLVIFFRGYSSASNKYEDIVLKYKAEVDKLTKDLTELTTKYTKATKEVTLDLIESEIKDIGELATIEYLYTDAGKFEDAKKLFGKDVPFTTKSFIAKWDGIIKAGVKIDEVTVEINGTAKEITIHMSAAEILSHEIKSDSIETLDEKNGLFNQVKVEDVRLFDAISKEEMEKRAIENGILDKAFENAKAVIEKLVNNDVVQEQEYTIIFK